MLIKNNLYQRTLFVGWGIMIWKGLVLLCITILVQWTPSYGELLNCTPLMANRSLWLSNTFRPSRNISSPRTFPSNQSVYCSWLVFVPNGYRIKIHFSSFDLVNSTNCSSSAVELAERDRDGVRFTSLGRYCGGHVPDDVVSTHSDVSVIYTANNGSTLQHSGFHALISLAPAKTCRSSNDPDANNNIELSGSNGRLVSPLSPFNKHIKKCRWTITAPRGHRIKLNFQAFHLGSDEGSNCENVDHVEVRDSFNKNDPAYWTFCGNVVPPPVYSVGPQMVVTFVSNEEKLFAVFEARYSAIPGGVCTLDNSIVQLNLSHNSTGRLSSPDYPLQFPPDIACFWRLRAPEGYHVKLQFTTINVQGNCTQDSKGGDWIRVDDYFTTDFPSVASYWGIFCSGARPPVIYSTRNELQVFFSSNYTSSENGRGANQVEEKTSIGFYAAYAVTPQEYTSLCRTDIYPDKPIELQGDTGSLVSPGYPHSYPIITCTWKIKVPDDHIVEVNIADFEMDCAKGSKLLVGENSFCGSGKPSGLLTSESDIKIQMIAKVARDKRGFRATFSMTNRELAPASIVPWIVIPIVVIAVCVTMFITYRRRTSGFDRRSSFKASIINRKRTPSNLDPDISHG